MQFCGSPNHVHSIYYSNWSNLRVARPKTLQLISPQNANENQNENENS